MAKLTEKKKEKIIKDLYSQVMKSYKYDSEGREELQSIINDKAKQDEIKYIVQNKDKLTEEEIVRLGKKYENSLFIKPLLLECNNVPVSMIKDYINKSISAFAARATRGYGYGKEGDSIAKAILSANLPSHIRSACANDLTKLYNSTHYSGNFLYFRPNGQTALTIAENLYYDLKSPIEKISIIKNIHPDESLSKEELTSRLEAMIDWDIDVAIDHMSDKTDSGKLKEQRYTAVLNNPNIDDKVIDRIYSTGEIDPYNIPEKISNNMSQEIYTMLSETLFNEEVESKIKQNACTPFLTFCKSGKFNFAQQYDFFQQMKTETKAGVSDYVSDRVIWHYLYHCENLNPEAVKTIIEFGSKGTQSRIFTLPNIPEEIKLACAPTYVEETKKNKIVKSNKSLMMALSVVGRMTELDKKRYEAILDNREKLKNEPRYTELYDAIKTSAKTPLEYLEKFESLEPNNLGIKIAKYGKWHNLPTSITDKLHDIMLRDFGGNARKATINVELFESVTNGTHKVDIQDFIKHMQDLCDSNHKIKKAIGDNLKSFDYFVKEYMITYNGDRDYYMSSISPSQFYADKKKAIIEEITKAGEGNIPKTKNQVIKAVVEKEEEYLDLMLEKNKRQSPNRETYVDMDELIETGTTSTPVTSKENQPQFLDEFLEER